MISTDTLISEISQILRSMTDVPNIVVAMRTKHVAVAWQDNDTLVIKVMTDGREYHD